MKTHDLADLLREHGRHLENQMTPLDLEQVSVYQAQPRPRADSNRRMAVWSVAAVIMMSILATAALLLARTGDGDEVADTPATTTVAPDVDLEIVEAGVAALYSGDAERAVELFELPDRTDEELRREAAYQAAIGGRLTLNCDELDAPGMFICNTPYQNAMTDAIGFADSPGDANRVVVEDGVITEFGLPEHSFILVSMGTYLATEGRFDGYEDCEYPGPFPVSCATIQLENLDAWKEWYVTVDAVSMVKWALGSWYGGDCVGALRLTAQGADDLCSTSDPASQTIQYESLLQADVSVEGCEETALRSDPQVANLSCEVHYSNVMNIAVGKPPSVTVREFTVHLRWTVNGPGESDPWYEADYPEDTELRASFRTFAESGDLQDEYAAANCANVRTPECANLVMDNLDEWAVWYETNS
ncbi:MAG TPA: hypothetical protein VF148_17995 [Acidimicrobiia bacterium]